MLERRRAARARRCTFAELDELRAAAAAVTVPGAILDRSREIRRELARQQIVVSDRRWKNRSAFCARTRSSLGRSAVTEDDLIFLEHVLWKDPEERPKVREAMRRLVKGYEDEARELLIQSQELREYAAGAWESEELRNRALIEAHTKIANILVRFDALMREASDRGPRDCERATGCASR